MCGGDGLSAQHGRNGTTSGRGAERQAETPENSREGKEALDGETGPSKTLQDAIDGFLDSKRSLKEFTLTNYPGSCRTR